MGTKENRVIIDTEIGLDIDDAFALLFALKHPNLDIAAITTVYGNVDLRAKIAKKLVDLAGQDIPVYTGEAKPFLFGSGYRRIATTGREGEGILTSEETRADIRELGIQTGAVDFLVQEIMEHPGEYNIVTLGGLTNIARALQKEPRIRERIKHLYMMAGSISYPEQLNLERPNHRRTRQEHNVYTDTLAAKKVLRSGIPMTMVTLDVTTQCRLYRKELETLRGVDQVNQAVCSMADVWFDYRDGVLETDVYFTCMHDPLTLALVVNPDLGKIVRRNVDVTVLGSKTRFSDGENVKVVYEADQAQIKEMFMRTISAPITYQ